MEGKGHFIADALFRVPVDDAEDHAEKISALSIIQSLDPLLDGLHQAVVESETYRHLLEAVSSLTPKQVH